MTFSTAKISKAGGRSVNQDCVAELHLADAGCWVVADGLGGHRGGEVASQLAVGAFLDSFRQTPVCAPDALTQHIHTCHEAVQGGQNEDHSHASMRTTLVALLYCGSSIVWGHVGDARFYHFRNGGIRFQTRDHSVPQTMVAAGDLDPADIRFHADRSRLLRAIGQPGDVRPTTHSAAEPVQANDAFLLCTDGFWEYVTEVEMEVALARSNHPRSWLQEMNNTIQSRVSEDHDNYSAVGIWGPTRENRPPVADQ